MGLSWSLSHLVVVIIRLGSTEKQRAGAQCNLRRLCQRPGGGSENRWSAEVTSSPAAAQSPGSQAPGLEGIWYSHGHFQPCPGAI